MTETITREATSTADEQPKDNLESVPGQPENVQDAFPPEGKVLVMTAGDAIAYMEAHPGGRSGREVVSLYASEIGNRLRTRRTRCKMSQAQVAAQLGVSQALVGQWELGKSRLIIDDLRRLAEVLKTTQAYLLGETFDPFIPKSQEKEESPAEVMKRAILTLVEGMNYEERQKLFVEAGLLLGLNPGGYRASMSSKGHDVTEP